MIISFIAGLIVGIVATRSRSAEAAEIDERIRQVRDEHRRKALDHGVIQRIV